MKCAAFRKGLDQMRSLWEKIKHDGNIPASESGIEFTPQIGGRKFRSLNKDCLQKEEEENLLQMEKKMRQVVGGKVWTCRDCSWRGKFSHKAKAHARMCGQRRREHVKKFKAVFLAPLILFNDWIDDIKNNIKLRPYTSRMTLRTPSRTTSRIT